MKKIQLALLVTSALAAGQASAVGQTSANTSGGTISFNGKITATSCNVMVNGGSASVTLPTVGENMLTKNGDKAGDEVINLTVSACSADTKVAAFFESGSATLPNGHLKNTAATNPASNVELELVDIDGTTPVKAGDATQAANNKTIDLAANGTGSLAYKVHYYATGAATAGDVTSSVVYSLMYK